MAEDSHRTLFTALDLLKNFSAEGKALVEGAEKKVDRYEDELGTYLVKLNQKDLSVHDSHSVSIMLHCIGDFERISDHAYNIMESAEQFHNMKKKFSDKAKKELRVYEAAVKDIVDITFDAYDRSDIIKASRVEPLEEVIDGLNKTVKKHHMKRLRKGKCTIGLGLVLSDLTMNYERVADHCSNIAVYMMQLNDTGLEEHSFTEQMDEKESAEFTKLENEFEQKYEID